MKQLKSKFVAVICAVITTALSTQAITSTPLSFSAYAAENTCGNNLEWSVSGDTLTISGSGTEMTDYGQFYNKAPWRTYSSTVKKVILPDTLKSIGSYAFYGMSALEYAYTSDSDDGFNLPCLPNCNTIGAYAFAQCYKFRGNTQSGSLTLGIGFDTVGNEEKIIIKDSAFQNCDQVRIIKCNFPVMEVEKYGFYNMDKLYSMNCEDTAAQLGYKAFYYDEELAKVNFKPSTLPIDNTAFNTTLYDINECTANDFGKRNIGSASKLNGKQLVVNFFVDKTSVNIDSPIRKYRWDYEMDVPLASDEIATDLSNYNKDYNHGSEFYVGVFKKKDLTCQYRYSWNPKKGDKTNYSAVTLNKFDFSSVSDATSIPLDTVQNKYTAGYYGSYVSSEEITKRLQNVDEAMRELQQQSKLYGNGFRYEMHPETNFHITYDNFKWDQSQATGRMGIPLNYLETAGYNGGDGSIVNGSNNAYESTSKAIGCDNDEALFKSIYAASENLYGENAHQIDLKIKDGSTVSEYTEYLKNKYHVDGVIYLVHFNTTARSYTEAVSSKYSMNRVDEFEVLYNKSDNVARMIAHETSHLFGAIDYYNGLSSEANSYVSNYKDELMFDSSYNVGPVTAFSIGWLDRIEKTTYNDFFSNR